MRAASLDNPKILPIVGITGLSALKLICVMKNSEQMKILASIVVRPMVASGLLEAIG